MEPVNQNKVKTGDGESENRPVVPSVTNDKGASEKRKQKSTLKK